MLGAVVAVVGSGALLAFALPGMASALTKQPMVSGEVQTRAGAHS
jgi:phosphoribosylcarboxyaminoimidazole (NCAIR) mutase